MKKKRFEIIITGVIILLISLSPIYSAALSKKSEISIRDLNQQINKIRTYHVNLRTKIYPPDMSDSNSNDSNDFDTNKYLKVKSTVLGVSGKKMNIVIYPKPPDVDLEMVHRFIYDGTWLWVEQKVIKFPKMKIDEPKITAMKIHIPTVSPDPVKEPFYTLYGQSGTGLFRYKDLPGTLEKLIDDYDFTNIENSNKSAEIIFSGFKRQFPEERNKEPADLIIDRDLKEFADQSTRYCKLWVSKDSGLIKAYFIGKSEEIPATYTEIEYLSINKKLPDNMFKYEPPNGVKVQDTTAAVMQRANKKGKQ